MSSVQRKHKSSVIVYCLLLCCVFTTRLLAQAPPAAIPVSSATPGELRVSIILVGWGPGTTSYVRFNLSGFRRGRHRQGFLRLYVDAVAERVV